MTKTEYLDFVRTWKINYAEISDQIRETKRERKTADEDRQAILNARRQRMRLIAHNMLKTRAEMKIKAQEAWLAERATQDETKAA